MEQSSVSDAEVGSESPVKNFPSNLPEHIFSPFLLRLCEKKMSVQSVVKLVNITTENAKRFVFQIQIEVIFIFFINIIIVFLMIFYFLKC